MKIMKVKKLINSAALLSLCLGSLTAVLPEATMATTALVTSNVYQTPTTSPAYSALTTSVPVNQPLALESTVNGCTPYGPMDGYQYDPKMLMELMGKPRTTHYGPFLSAHRGVWGTNLGTSPSGVPLVNAAENSITAIDNAAKLKFEMVELDVKEAADGKLVLMHDYTMGRTTKNNRGSNDQWDVFRQLTPDGQGPVYKPNVNPKILTDDNWNNVIKPYNPLIIQNQPTDIRSLKLKVFDKSSNNDLGEMTIEGVTVKAKGQWGDTPNNDTVPDLRQSLTHIGNNYPGMTVVLDLRHLNEVKEAMNVIDQLKDCQGTPAKDWVILKPFANVFKGGYYNAQNLNASQPAPDSVIGMIGPRANNYKWIPVLSNRLVPPIPQGEPSVIPGSPGPDPSQIVGSAVDYSIDWWEKSPGNTVTIENGYNGNGDASNPLKAAYDWAIQRSTNMQSWRPADIRVENEVVLPSGKVVNGFNWKDDGMGAYPTYKDTTKDYSEQRKTAGILTVEDAPYVMKLEALTRAASTRVISKVVDWSKFDTASAYKIVNYTTGRDLKFGGLDGELWYFSRKNNNVAGFNIINAYQPAGLPFALNLNGGGNSVNLYALDRNHVDQSWALAGSGAFSIINGNLKTLGDDQGNWVARDGVSNGDKWLLVPIADYTLQQVDKGWVADIDHDRIENGTPIVSFEKRSGYPNQKWRFIFNTDGTYSIVNPRSSKFMTSEGSNGVAIQPFESNYPNQKWQLKYDKGTDSYAFIIAGLYLKRAEYGQGLVMSPLDNAQFNWRMTTWNP